MPTILRLYSIAIAKQNVWLWPLVPAHRNTYKMFQNNPTYSDKVHFCGSTLSAAPHLSKMRCLYVFLLLTHSYCFLILQGVSGMPNWGSK